MKVSVVSNTEDGGIRRIGEIALSGKVPELVRTKSVVVGFREHEGELIGVLLPASELKATAKKALE